MAGTRSRMCSTSSTRSELSSKARVEGQTGRQTDRRAGGQIRRAGGTRARPQHTLRWQLKLPSCAGPLGSWCPRPPVSFQQTDTWLPLVPCLLPLDTLSLLPRPTLLPPCSQLCTVCVKATVLTVLLHLTGCPHPVLPCPASSAGTSSSRTPRASSCTGSTPAATLTRCTRPKSGTTSVT